MNTTPSPQGDGTAGGASAPPAPIPVLNIANALTVLRLLLVPVFLWLYLQGGDPARLAGALVFMVASWTDRLDGHLARTRGLVTSFGKIADPIADKALTLSAFVLLSVDHRLWWWVTVVIIVRELGITLLRFLMLRRAVMAASRGGKLKTVMQSVALAMFLPGLQFMPAVWDVVAWIAMILAFVLTVLTGLDYLREANKLRTAYLAEHPQEGTKS